MLNAALCIFALLLASCSHRVSYALPPKKVGPPTFPSSLKVVAFKLECPLQEKGAISVDGKLWQTNCMDYYDPKEKINEGVARMIADDFENSNFFASVLAPHEVGSADYELHATLFDYTAMGKKNRMLENVVIGSTALFNVPGMLISGIFTSGIKTDIITSVALKDIKLVHVKSGRVVWKSNGVRAGGTHTRTWSKADAGPLMKLLDEEVRVVSKYLKANFKKLPLR